MTFRNVRQIRFNNLSIRTAAKQIGISKTALSDYEAYRKFPKVSTLKKIQKKYNLTNEEISTLYLDYFLNKKES